MTAGTCCRALRLCWRLSVSDMADVAFGCAALHHGNQPLLAMCWRHKECHGHVATGYTAKASSVHVQCVAIWKVLHLSLLSV